MKPLRVDGGFNRLTEILPALRDTDGGFNRLTEILPALRDTDGGLLTTRWIIRRFESSTECGFC